MNFEHIIFDILRNLEFAVFMNDIDSLALLNLFII